MACRMTHGNNPVQVSNVCGIWPSRVTSMDRQAAS